MGKLLGIDTPTVDALVAVVPLAAAHLMAMAALVWLSWRVLVVLDRELARKRCQNPQDDTPRPVFDRLTQTHTIQDTTADGPDDEAR